MLDDITLKLKDDMTIIDILEQCQEACPKLLCLIKNKNGEEKIRIYKKKEQIPNLTYSHCVNQCYYFNLNDDVYIVFGSLAATLINPLLKSIDSPPLLSIDKDFPQPDIKNEHVFLKPVNDYNIILYDQGHKYIFPNINNNLVIKKVHIF